MLALRHSFVLASEWGLTIRFNCFSIEKQRLDSRDELGRCLLVNAPFASRVFPESGKRYTRWSGHFPSFGNLQLKASRDLRRFRRYPTCEVGDSRTDSAVVG